MDGTKSVVFVADTSLSAHDDGTETAESGDSQDGENAPSFPSITGKGDGNPNDGTDKSGVKDAQVSDNDDTGDKDKTTDDPAKTEDGDAKTDDTATVPDEDEGGSDANTEDKYLLPTDTVYITEDDLKGFDRWQCTLALNEIYARNGYRFKDADLRNYFEAQSWYNPDTNDSNKAVSRFNAYERTNKETILQYMKDQGWR